MNCYTSEAVEAAMAQAFYALMWGSVLACFVGAFAGRVSYWCVLLFLRRLPRWRRFERAMTKVIA